MTPTSKAMQELGVRHSTQNKFTKEELKTIKRLKKEIKQKGDEVALLFSDSDWNLWMEYNGGSIIMVVGGES